MRAIIIIIAIFCIVDVNIVSARPHLAMSRSYIRNLENAVNFDCNSQAFNQTNNIDIYDCIRYKHSNCHSNINFTEYINIKKKCIIAKQS